MTTTEVYPEKTNFNGERRVQLPSSINVLTILTFIGSGIGLIFTALFPVINNFLLKMIDGQMESGRDISANDLAEMENGKAVIEASLANMIPLMVIGFIGIALCVVGAIWMRKLRKDGYWLYVAGEILPVLGGLILLGTDQYTGVMSVIISLGIPLIFIALYTMQLKFFRR